MEISSWWSVVRKYKRRGGNPRLLIRRGSRNQKPR